MATYCDTKGNIFMDPLSQNFSFLENTFKIDTLMSPIIAELNKKGYTTNACCHGHIFNAFVTNFEECVDDPLVEFEYANDLSIAPPYIMFADDVEVPYENLPSSWYWEFSTPRSGDIKSDEDAENMLTYNFPPDKIPPEVNDKSKGFNIEIRPSDDLIGYEKNSHGEWIVDFSKYEEDPYIFYIAMAKAHSDLYRWAKSLPYKKKGM